MTLNDKMIVTLEPYVPKHKWSGVRDALEYQDEISTLASVIYSGFKFSTLINPNISPEVLHMFKMFNKTVKSHDALATFSGFKFQVEELSKNTSKKRNQLEEKLLNKSDQSIPLRFTVIDEYLPYQNALLGYLKTVVALIYANDPEKFKFLPHIHLWGKICITGNDCVEIILDMIDARPTHSKLNSLVKKISRFVMLVASIFSTYLGALTLGFLSVFTGVTMVACDMLKSNLNPTTKRPLLTFDPYLLDKV